MHIEEGVIVTVKGKKFKKEIPDTVVDKIEGLRKTIEKQNAKTKLRKEKEAKEKEEIVEDMKVEVKKTTTKKN